MAGDRLSSLSDDLIHHILSFIPSTKLHAQTSVLSKRWRLIWAHHPNLHLSMPYPDIAAAAEEIDSIAKIYVLSVNRCLRSFNSPSLNSVTIDLWLPTSLSAAESRAHLKTADRWIRFAGLRSARKLTVQARSEPHDWYSRIPSSVFSLHRSLTDLTVHFSAVPDVPDNFPGFRNLTSLCVGCGIISNETVEGLLEGCPLLEDLKLVGCIGLEYVEISPRRSPRLKNLLLLSFYHRKWIGARIDAPNLRSIQFGGSVSNLDWRGSAVLTEANLTTKSEEDFKSFEDWMKIVLAVSNVRVLKVNYWFYQFEIPKNYSSGLLFKNLKELHCDIDWVTGSVFRSLTHCLAECPLLEKLMINLNREVRTAVKDLVQKASNAGAEDTPELYYTSSPFLHTDALVKRVQDEHEQDTWNPAEHFGELDCCLHHLKIVTVKEFVGSKNEMRLFEFLLGKAIALEQFIVFDLLNRGAWDLQEIFATVAKASSQVDMRLSLWENLEDKFFKRIFA